MASFKPFSFYESLQPKSKNALDPVFHVNASQQPEVILLRLLSGTLDLKNNTSGVFFKQRNNYAYFDFSANSRLSASLITSIFTSDGISRSKFTSYYKNCHKYGNRKLFENLLLELSNYFFQTYKGSHATAFLHLYRSFELISYCFPLFYASKATSYEKTFTSLKEYFSKIDGERPFFKKFVHDHFI